MRFIHQAKCGEQRISWTLVQAPVNWIQKGNKVPMWLHWIQLMKSVAEKREEKMVHEV